MRLTMEEFNKMDCIDNNTGIGYRNTIVFLGVYNNPYYGEHVANGGNLNINQAVF